MCAGVSAGSVDEMGYPIVESNKLEYALALDVLEMDVDDVDRGKLELFISFGWNYCFVLERFASLY